MKKTVAILLTMVCIFSMIVPVALSVSAAGAYTTSYKRLNNCSSAYSRAGGTLRGQTMLEKSITVKRGEKWIIKPQLSVGARQRGDLADDVRFSVWIYDCSTGKRVKAVTLRADETYQLPRNLLKNKTYSVQIRPYMDSAVWKHANRYLVNAYLYNAACLYRLQYYKK